MSIDVGWTEEYIVPEGSTFRNRTVIRVDGQPGCRVYTDSMVDEINNTIAQLQDEGVSFSVFNRTTVSYPEQLQARFSKM